MLRFADHGWPQNIVLWRLLPQSNWTMEQKTNFRHHLGTIFSTPPGYNSPPPPGYIFTPAPGCPSPSLHVQIPHARHIQHITKKKNPAQMFQSGCGRNEQILGDNGPKMSMNTRHLYTSECLVTSSVPARPCESCLYKVEVSIYLIHRMTFSVMKDMWIFCFVLVNYVCIHSLRREKSSRKRIKQIWYLNF